MCVGEINQYSLGGVFFLFPIVLVPRYKLSLCHTPIKPDLLSFPGIGVFAYGLHDHVITRFISPLIFQYPINIVNEIIGCRNQLWTQDYLELPRHKEPDLLLLLEPPNPFFFFFSFTC